MTDRYFIGLMSGTSMDGVDGVLCQATNCEFKVMERHSLTYPPALKKRLQEYSQGSLLSAKEHGELQNAAAKVFSSVASTLAKTTSITAIGSHGQTVWHQPSGESGFSLQLDNPALIATATNMAVVANFRNQDIANGGQGAPLVPPFHQFLFADSSKNRIALNLGGIANITVLSKTAPVGGYDIGPANCLSDRWCLQHTGNSFDDNGHWGLQGQLNDPLLVDFLDDEFFRQPAPKSTGLEKFNSNWLAAKLAKHPNLAPADVQLTLYHLTAELVAREARQHNTEEVVVCGGGANNGALMNAIQQRSKISVVKSDDFGIGVQDVEAAAFAWLAMLRVDGTACQLGDITGTKKATCLGGLYLP